MHHAWVGYSDSDLGGDVDSRKSTSGTLFLLGSSPVTWQSQKQQIVAVSSCESEYVLTKPLGRVRLAELRSSLGMVEVSSPELKPRE